MTQKEIVLDAIRELPDDASVREGIPNMTSDRLLTPGIFSSTHQISPTNRYICFLTYDDPMNSSTDTFQARAIGKGRYAHDAFELATERALKEVGALVTEKRK